MTPPPNGFWAQATADPHRTVLVAPDGEEWSAGRLHADVNRMVHGLRAAGMRAGDAFAVVLPNGTELLTAHLAASQAGFYLVPVNHHLTGPETAWIVSDSGAASSSPTNASPPPRRPPPTRPVSPAATATPWGPSPAAARTPTCSTATPPPRRRTARSAGS